MSVSYEDIIGRALSGGLVELFKRSLDIVIPKLRTATESVKSYDMAGSIAKKYAETMVPRYGSMRIFGMQHPIPLTDVYTHVNVLEDITAQRRLSVGDLDGQIEDEYQEEFFKIGQRSFGKIRITRTGDEAFSELDRFVLLGKPGSGKTTFLKHIFLSTLVGQIEGNRIPLLVSLNQAADNDDGVIGVIHREFELCGVGNPAAFVKQSLSDGRFVVLLDGLDEVRDSKRRDIVRQITDMSDQYPDNKFVVTCRVAAYSYWLERFSNVEIADFKQEQVIDYSRRWFHNSPSTADHFIGALSKSRSLQDLSKTPLLLTIMCIAYSETFSISENRSELYRDAVDALLKRWDASRSIKRDEFYKELTLKRKEDLFAYLASETFPQNRFFLRRSEWEQYAAKYLENLPNVSKDTLKDDAGVVIEAIASQHGILVERAAGIYSFSHLTFVEYFMARYANDADSAYQVELVKKCISIDQWREVIILLACLVNNADHILIALMEAAEEYGFDSKPVRGLKINFNKSLYIKPVGFEVNRKNRNKRTILQVVRDNSDPSLEDVEERLKNRKKYFLPRANKQFLEIAVNICKAHILGFSDFVEKYIVCGAVDKIPKSIYKSLVKRIDANMNNSVDGGEYSDLVDKGFHIKSNSEKYIMKEYLEFRLSQISMGLHTLEADVNEVIMEEMRGADNLKDVKILGRKQKRPGDLFEARDLIVAGIVGLFEEAFQGDAAKINEEGIEYLRTMLIEAMDANTDSELRQESLYIYISDLFVDLLKQPVVATPEVRKAVMWMLLSDDNTSGEPHDPGLRLRAAR